MYNNLNQKLSDMRSGNYLVKVTSIGNRRPNEWYDREYFVTVKFQDTDLNNGFAKGFFFRTSSAKKRGRGSGRPRPPHKKS